MKLLVTFSSQLLADELEEKLFDSEKEVLSRSAGTAAITHKRVSPNQLEMELIMRMGNLLTDRVLRQVLEKTLKKIDPDVKIEKIKEKK